MEDMKAGEAQEQAAQQAASETPSDPIQGLEAKVNDADPAKTLGGVERAPDVADTSGDTAGAPAGAHLDAPAAAVQPEKAAETPAVDPDDEFAVACAEGKPRIALVGKYGDRVPVQLKSKAHLETLKGEHPGAVEVQS